MKGELADELRVSIDTTPATNYPASISGISSTSSSLSIARVQPEPLLHHLDVALLRDPSQIHRLRAEIAPISDCKPQNGYCGDLAWVL